MPMHKTIIELGNINKLMRLKFNLMIENENPIKGAASRQDIRTIHQFMVGGTEYFKLCPHPYLTIDISKSSDRGDSWNANTTVNLSNQSIFRLRKLLKRMIDGFQVKDLFYKQNGKLILNRSVADKMVQHVKLISKTVAMVYAVVPDEENKEVEYEGLCFIINSVDNFCYLTYNEAEYLLYRLSSIDLYSLTMQAIQTYYLELIARMLGVPKQEIPQKTFSFSEKKEDSVETPPYAQIKDPSEIPEI